jgi:YD repeat-containing protein
MPTTTQRHLRALPWTSGRRLLRAAALAACVLVACTTVLGGTGTRRYTYDRLGRLVRVDLPNGSVSEFVYDAAGNIVSTRTSPLDTDGDGVADAEDCAPGDGAVYPGSAEINDGKDNQCLPGEAGHGLVDEILGPLRFTTRTTLAWPAQPGATMYEVARSPAATFAGGCVKSYSPLPTLEAEAQPAAGAAYFYLVRPFLPHAGSWGAAPGGSERNVCP